MPHFKIQAIAVTSLLAGGPAFAETVVISQKDKTFSEKEVTISVNDELEFHNFDDTAHSILSFTPGMEFDLKLQRPNEIKRQVFNKPGKLEINCDIHPKMSLIVNVK